MYMMWLMTDSFIWDSAACTSKKKQCDTKGRDV